MDNKKIRFFISGFLAGASFIFLIILIPAYMNRGSEIRSMKSFGNIKITPFEVDPKYFLAFGESLVIQKDQEPILTLYFDYNKKLADLTFLHNNKPLFSASVNPDLQKWGMFSYGYYETGISYYDKNCDGFFDDMDVDRVRTDYIFIDNAWLKVDEKKGFKASIGSGSSIYEYIFSLEKGWVEKTPEQKENLDPNDIRD
jgi:hypothetical protein